MPHVLKTSKMLFTEKFPVQVVKNVKQAHTDASIDNKCHFECLVSKRPHECKCTIMFVSSEKHMSRRLLCHVSKNDVYKKKVFQN